jgi:hypothetical protein
MYSALLEIALLVSGLETSQTWQPSARRPSPIFAIASDGHLRLPVVAIAGGVACCAE